MSGFAHFLKTGVARKLFLLFILSALLPLAAIGFLSLSKSRSMLLQQGDQRITITAKSYGMGLFERLLLAADLAVTVANSGPAAGGEALPERVLRTLAAVDGAGKVRPIMGRLELPTLPPGARSRLDDGRPAVIVAGEASRPTIFVAARLPRSGGGYVIGEVAGPFLWGPMDEVPAATELCVAEEKTRRILYCHAEGGAGALRR